MKNPDCTVVSDKGDFHTTFKKLGINAFSVNDRLCIAMVPYN